MENKEFNTIHGYDLISRKVNTLFINIAAMLDKKEISTDKAKDLFEQLSTISKICIDNKEYFNYCVNDKKSKISF